MTHVNIWKHPYLIAGALNSSASIGVSSTATLPRKDSAGENSILLSWHPSLAVFQRSFKQLQWIHYGHCPWLWMVRMIMGIHELWFKWSQQWGWTWYYHTVCSQKVLHSPNVGMLKTICSHGEPWWAYDPKRHNPHQSTLRTLRICIAMVPPKPSSVQSKSAIPRTNCKISMRSSSFLRCMKAVNQCIGRSIRHARRRSWCRSVAEKCRDVVSFFLQCCFNENERSKYIQVICV